MMDGNIIRIQDDETRRCTNTGMTIITVSSARRPTGRQPTRPQYAYDGAQGQLAVTDALVMKLATWL